MVGHSRQVYKGCMELIVARFADTIDSSSPHITLKDAGYCLLRSQLLMALHDQGANELCAAERVHKLAWTLDAAHKARTCGLVMWVVDGRVVVVCVVYMCLCRSCCCGS